MNTGRFIVVLFTGHVGSSWLTSLLATHPEISRLGFEPVDQLTERGVDAEQSFRTFLEPDPSTMLPADIRAVFEKTTADSVDPEPEPGPLAAGDPGSASYTVFKTRLLFMKQKGFFVDWLPGKKPFLLLLRRRNKIKNAVSQYKRARLQISHLHDFDRTAEKRRPVNVDVNYVMWKAQQFTLRELRSKAYFSLLTDCWGATGREILYEDLLAHSFRHDFFDWMFRTLGLQAASLHSEYEKMTKDALDEAVENYDELSEAAKTTPLASCLEDTDFDVVNEILEGRMAFPLADEDPVLKEIQCLKESLLDRR